jgi:hypothetical protein
MTPQSLLAIKDQPQFAELVSYLKAEAARLNTLDGIAENAGNIEIALEVLARKRASDILRAVLAPLTHPQDIPSGIDPKEYVA